MEELMLKCESLPAQIDLLFDKSDIFNQITTRAADPNAIKLGTLQTFNEMSLSQIASNMIEINRASKVFGRKNSQVTNKLMTLQMLQDASPYRVMRQCISEIENRRMAIKENIFKLRRDKVDLEEKIIRLTTMKNENISKHIIDHQIIDIEELVSNMEDSMIYLEGALKDVYSFQSAYDQIKKNNNIPDKWDEKDFENAEIKSNIRFAFLLVYRNSMSVGRMDAGTLEYLHQFGIHPQQASEEVLIYLQEAETNKHDYESFEIWLDTMSEKYGKCYEAVMSRIGLDHIHDEEAMYTEIKTPISEDLIKE